MKDRDTPIPCLAPCLRSSSVPGKTPLCAGLMSHLSASSAGLGNGCMRVARSEQNGCGGGRAEGKVGGWAGGREGDVVVGVGFWCVRVFTHPILWR